MGAFTGKRVLITGGTGSLGNTLLRRLLDGREDLPARITIFSRDEAKQHAMKAEYQLNGKRDLFNAIVRFRIGDVRDYHSMASALHDTDIVFNTAAVKQVPTCEYFPYEAVRTNIEGPENIIRTIEEGHLKVETVIGISTDKACKPVNVMGMTKAIQERIFIHGNLRASGTRFVCVRYGNVLASRGSVIPLFLEQIAHGGPITVTTEDMTRFLLTLDQAVDIVFAAVKDALLGEIYIPRAAAARIIDVARALVGNRDIAIKVTGVRPGEKTHEILVSEEEAHRTALRGDYYVIAPSLPELKTTAFESGISKEYSSNDSLLTLDEVNTLLTQNGFIR